MNNQNNLQKVIIPCKCGTMTHYSDSVYCGTCGAKLKKEKYNAIEAELIDALERYMGYERLR